MRYASVLSIASGLFAVSLIASAQHQPLAAASPEAISLLVSELYPYALEDDEYVVIFNPGETYAELEGWQLADGEGTISFAEGVLVPPGSGLSVSFNASSYLSAYGVPAAVALDDSAMGSLCDVDGTFRLGNSGDSVILVNDDGVVVDSVSYGDHSDQVPLWIGYPIPPPRAGEVFKRVSSERGLHDTGTSVDWMPFREHRYGYTSWDGEVGEVPPGGVTAFVSPDCAADVLLGLIDTVSSRVRLCTYELSSPSVCSGLLDALGRGVEVRILVDGSPVGGMCEDEVAALSVLATSGASVRVLSGSVDERVVRHFSALHAKYLVLDSDTVVVMSENLVPTGISVDRVFGNRGWGVAVESARLASYLAEVFDDDSRPDRRDVVEWLEDARYDPAAVATEEEASAHPAGMLPRLVTTQPSAVTLVLSPDASAVEPFLTGLLISEGSVLVEQFQADLMWRDRWSEYATLNPLVDAVLTGARNGSSSRVLLDSTWFNLERNGEVVDALSLVSYAESLDLESRLLDNRSPVAVLHNKGVVVDSHLSVVSSNNWVYASFARNRELAAVVDSVEVASYFTQAFETDWHADSTPPVIRIEERVHTTAGSWVSLSAVDCTDDRVIASISWDVGDDGSIDLRGDSVSVFMAFPGETTVTLTVRDAWGNEATVRLTIVVAEARYAPSEDDRNVLTPYAIPAGVAACIAMTLATWKRRRRRHR